MKGPAAALKFWHHNQMKKQKHNVHRIFGINNALAVLASERFFIRRVELQKNGRAEKSEKLLNLINFVLCVAVYTVAHFLFGLAN